ncbi:MAG TPA: hypothetical protein VLA29_09800, partial [Acidimicrobiia bacterium]|nr:hypothetical protein [Acidimicrobiia bacterium]
LVEQRHPIYRQTCVRCDHLTVAGHWERVGMSAATNGVAYRRARGHLQGRYELIESQGRHTS